MLTKLIELGEFSCTAYEKLVLLKFVKARGQVGNSLYVKKMGRNPSLGKLKLSSQLATICFYLLYVALTRS